MNGFVINSRGNYSPEYHFKKPLNTKRVVILGDSIVTSTVPYPYGFVRVLEERLKSDSIPVQMINLGFPCIGPVVEKTILAEEGIKYQPDIILLSFFVGNDFIDDQTYITMDKQTKQSFIQQVVHHSYLASFLKTQYLLSTIQNKPQATQKNSTQSGTYIGIGYNSVEPTFLESEYLTLTSKLIDILIPNHMPQDQLTSIKQSIIDMQYIAHKINAKFLVVIIPAEFQVNMKLLSSAIALSQLSQSTFDPKYPQYILQTFLQDNHIPYVDILSNWENNPSAQQYYHPQDTHLNIEGNQSVAEILYPTIFELLQNK